METKGYASATLLRLVAIALNAVGSLLLLPLVLKTLGEYNFGIWALATTLTGYLLLLDFGIAAACTRYLSSQSGDEAGWRRTLSSSMLLSWVLAGLLLLAAVLAQVAANTGWLGNDHQPLTDVITLLLVEVGLSIPLRLYQSILRAEVRYLQMGWFEIIRIVLRLLGIPLILWLGGGLMAIVLYGSLVNLLFFLMMFLSVYWRDQTTHFQRISIDLQHLQELFSFSKYMAVTQVAEFFKYRTDNLLVGLLLGVGAVAPYAIMIVVVDMVAQILTRFQGYWDTIIIRHAGQGRPAAALDTMLTSLQIGMALALLAAFNLSLLGDWFLTLWVGEQYAYLTPALVIFSLVMVGYACQAATTPYFNALHQQRANAWLASGEILLKLLLVVPLAHVYGFKGVVYAGVLATLLFLLLRLRLVAVLVGSSLWNMLTIVFRKIAPVLLLLLCAGGVSLALGKTGLPVFASMALVLAVQALGLFFWIKNPGLRGLSFHSVHLSK